MLAFGFASAFRYLTARRCVYISSVVTTLKRPHASKHCRYFVDGRDRVSRPFTFQQYTSSSRDVNNAEILSVYLIYG